MPRRSHKSSKSRRSRRSNKKSPRHLSQKSLRRSFMKMHIHSDKVKELIKKSPIREGGISDIIQGYSNQKYLYYKVDKENAELLTKTSKPSHMRGWKTIPILDDNEPALGNYVWVGRAGMSGDNEVNFIAIAPNRNRLNDLIYGKYKGDIFEVKQYKYTGTGSTSKIIAKLVRDFTYEFDY
jgi:hypothetical protein